MEVVQACFKTRNVLKFSFDSCRCVMLIDSCFSGEVRCFHCRGGPVEFVQLCFGIRNVLKFSFDNCRGRAMVVNSCFSAGKIR